MRMSIESTSISSFFFFVFTSSFELKSLFAHSSFFDSRSLFVDEDFSSFLLVNQSFRWAEFQLSRIDFVFESNFEQRVRDYARASSTKNRSRNEASTSEERISRFSIFLSFCKLGVRPGPAVRGLGKSSVRQLPFFHIGDKFTECYIVLLCLLRTPPSEKFPTHTFESTFLSVLISN